LDASATAMEEGWHPGTTPAIVALSVMLATFMQVLDSTVVNVSLPHIAGNLSATTNESTWVITSYLAANAIVLPATGWLGMVFGRKRFYMVCVAGFAAASLLCGTALTLHALVFFRVLQGLAGGAMQPISQAILLESFPLRRRGMGMAIFGIGVVIAPIIGPTLGGWITDSYSWRWIFYINIPVALVALAMTGTFVVDPPYLRRGVARVDYLGLGFLAVGIGALQVVLDNGQSKDWFQTSWITQLTVLAVVCLAALIVWERRTKQPIIDLDVFRVRNYTPGTILIFALGLALFGSMVLLPIFLQNLLGYTAMLSGLAMSPGGVGSLICMPLVGYLVGKRDARFLVIFGLCVLAASMFMMSHYNLQIGFWDAVWPRLVMGVGMAFLFVPLTTVTFAFMRPQDISMGTGLFNLVRNVGGSLGIAGVTTILARRAQFHYMRLAENVSAYDPGVQQALRTAVGQLTTTGQDYWTAQKQALGLTYAGVVRQASLMSFVDCFWLMGMAMVIMLPLVFIMRKPPRYTRRVAAAD
jgi:DHA2 family multidrug resistance protein